MDCFSFLIYFVYIVRLGNRNGLNRYLWPWADTIEYGKKLTPERDMILILLVRYKFDSGHLSGMLDKRAASTSCDFIIASPHHA